MTLIQVVWAATLVIVILLVPVAIALLHRTFTAARSIQRYLAEMEAAGAQIANNTGAVSALDATEAGAVSMLETADKLNRHSASLAEALTTRAQQGGLL